MATCKSSRCDINNLILNIWYKNYEHNGKEVNLLIIGIRPIQHDRVELNLTFNTKTLANVICKQITKSTSGNIATLIPEKITINLTMEE
jgi:hypothetical protein